MLGLSSFEELDLLSIDVGDLGDINILACV